MSSPQPQPDSPWARPTAGPDPVILAPSTGPAGPAYAAGPASAAGSAPLGAASGSGRAGRFAAGTVTGGLPVPVPRSAPLPEAPPDAAAVRRRTMRWFAGSTAGVLAVGIVVLLAMIMTGRSPFTGRPSKTPDLRPLLAKMCPPPSAGPAPSGPVPPAPAGPRIVDRQSGISYRAYGSPWRAWDLDWVTEGELDMPFRTGQYFETEAGPDGDGYYATILSGAVPAATNDAMTLDLKCAGQQVAADVRVSYYPQPNTMQPIRDSAAVLGGRPAWVSEFRLHFHEAGLKADNELVAIAVIDVGRPSAAVLYVSIPGTHRQYDSVIDQLLASVRPT